MNDIARSLSENFLEDLKTGMLSSVLERVKRDDTLMLAIRKDYLNIYYRGANLMRVNEKSPHKYEVFFDKGYRCDKLPGKDIGNSAQIDEWLKMIPELKQCIDFHLHEKKKLEREFQQVVARENNRSPIANESEYFITDIEFQDTDINARIDMTAVRWGARDRPRTTKCRPAFIEMKYGDRALDGDSGLIDHLKDLCKLIESDRYQTILRTMERQFDTLHELGLITFNESKSFSGITFSDPNKPEVIFLLANHNPRSSKLKNILNGKVFDEFANSDRFDLRFFVASFAGYGLHTDNMLTLDQMRALLNEQVPHGVALS